MGLENTIDNDDSKRGFAIIELLVAGAALTVVVGGGVLVYKANQAYNKYMSTPAIKMERVNVIGDERAEQFVEIGGKRYYAEIDGMRVEDYLQK